MARSKTFVEELALDAAVDVFREHSFERTSAETLVQTMGIGRPSLYDTFGDKWQLYRSSPRRYVGAEALAHGAALRSQPRAIDGIQALLNRVIADAREACLGVHSICEFGRTQPEVTEIHDAASRVIRAAILKRVREAQTAGDVWPDIDPEEARDSYSQASRGSASRRVAARMSNRFTLLGS